MSFLASCRVCKSKKLVEIGSLGDIAISDFTKRPSKGHKYPLALVYCKDCTLLQLDKTAPRNLLYKNYWYQSHINPVIEKDLKQIGGLCKGLHIDIGSNDGTLLKYSKAKAKIAVDPSNIEPDGCSWIQAYWENVALVDDAQTITAIACLYDLPNPNRFIANVKTHLAPNGVFIAQLQTLSPMVELNDVGNICHEHIEYYSYKSLKVLFERNGLEIYKVETNTINGGSYRIFARHLNKGSIDFQEKTYRVKELKNFFKRISRERDSLKFFLKTYINKHVYGYGASTKANTILQYYQVKLRGIVDVNPQKNAMYTVATNIPIIDKIPADCEYLWVFPYGFLDYFKKKEKGYKGKWITTIPEFKVYESSTR